MVSLARHGNVPRPALSAKQMKVRRARRALAGRGLGEAVTYSFISSGHARQFGGTDPGLVLVNPISSDMSTMRPSVIPGLLEAAARNHARGMQDVGIFEIGPVYASTSEDGQKTAVAGLRTGRSETRHWMEAGRAVDVFDAKADALAVLEAVDMPVDRLQTTANAPDWFHPGRSGILHLGPNTLACFGRTPSGCARIQ